MRVDLTITNLSEIVSPKGKPPVCGKNMSQLSIRKNKNIAIKDGKIVYIGSEIPPALRTINANGAIALPGLVDPHTHIPFTGNRAHEFIMRLHGKSYMEIMQAGGGILSTVKAVRKASLKELVLRGAYALNEMLKLGVTTVEGKSGYGLEKTAEIKQLKALKLLNKVQLVDVIPTFLGAHALPEEFEDKKEYLNYLSNMLKDVRKYTDTVDIFCEKGVFEVEESREFLERAKAMGFRLRLHADELAPSGAGKLAVELGAVSADHLISADDETLEAISKSATTAVILPGTSFFLKERFARGRKMIDLGSAVALASDFNPGSCNIYDPYLIMHLAVTRCGLEIEEAVTAYTINAAHILNLSNRKGKIEEGYDADIVLLGLNSYTEIPYMFSRITVVSVIKSGRVVFHES